jgi:hypothetical protein
VGSARTHIVRPSRVTVKSRPYWRRASSEVPRGIPCLTTPHPPVALPLNICPREQLGPGSLLKHGAVVWLTKSRPDQQVEPQANHMTCRGSPPADFQTRDTKQRTQSHSLHRFAGEVLKRRNTKTTEKTPEQHSAPSAPPRFYLLHTTSARQAMPDDVLQRTLLTGHMSEKSHVFQDQSTPHHSFRNLYNSLDSEDHPSK